MNINQEEKITQITLIDMIQVKTVSYNIFDIYSEEMTEMFEEEGHSKNYISNQVRNNQIKVKKNSNGVDRQQLYADNLELRNRVKELAELNTKMKTQLSISEKEKLNLCHIAEDQVFHPKIVQRSHSGNHKKSGTSIPTYQNNGPGFFANSIQKQKQNVAMKKMIRQQTIQVQKLNNENQRLKKTMKYTRMNQILAQNQELINQTLRLKGIISQRKDNQSRLSIEFSNEIEALRKRLSYEKDSEKRNGYQLKKQMDVNAELKEKVVELEGRRVEVQKRLARQTRTLRGELNDAKSKLYGQTILKGKQCDRQDCIKMQREKLQLKKKKEGLEKQVKKLEKDLNTIRRQSDLKDRDAGRMQQELDKSKLSQKQSRNASVPRKQINKTNNSQISQPSGKEVSKQKQQNGKRQDKQDNRVAQQTVKITNEPQEKQKVMQVSNLSEKKVQQENKEEQLKNKYYLPPKMENNLIDNKLLEPAVHGNLDQSDSMNTEKLLQSVEGMGDLNLESDKKQKTKRIGKEYQNQKIEKVENIGNRLGDSDGEYEELNYDDFEPEDAEVESKKAKKEVEAKDQVKKKQKKDKGKEEKKSKDKVQKVEPQEQMLYQAKPQKQVEKGQDDKAELKLIRETLFYKFMAQNYGYQNFCSDIKDSKMKQFSISDLINLMGSQPFILADQQVQTVLMYVLDTDSPTGQQVISSKDYMKKMKKFIGKTKEVNEQKQSENLKYLSALIEKDYASGQKMRKKFSEYDNGDNTLTLQQFSSVMESFKVKGAALQTAIAHIAYVSEDLNTLNYDLFLKRFASE